MRRVSFILLLLVIFATIFFIYNSLNRDSDIEQAGLIEIDVQLQWFHGAQFAGLYAAYEKGYFQDEGLKVNLIEGGYSTNPFDILTNGKAEIGIATGDQVLKKKAEGQEIKAVGTVFNTSIACFMAKKSSGIKDLEDFYGHKIGVYRNFDTEHILLSLINLHNLDIEKLDIVDAGSITAFENGELEIFPSYRINEPVSMELQNIPVKLFKPEDYGVSFYSDTYFTSDEYLDKNRDVVVRFIRASAKGWEFAKNDPTEAIRFMYNYAKNKSANDGKEKEIASLQEAVKYLGDGNNDWIHYMDKSKWIKMEEHLLSIKKINLGGNVEPLCDFRIIEESME